MASQLDVIRKLPPSRLAVVWLGGALLFGAAWYFLFYADAVEAREAAQRAVQQAQAELAEIEAKERSFNADLTAVTRAEKEIEAAKAVLPLNDATIDHLMRTFQREARLVGLTIERWTPGAEQKQDFYAKLPVEISARASWHQAAEFLRRISALTQIVNVENLSMHARNKNKGDDSDRVMLDVKFQASTFRFLTDAERSASKGKRKGGRRRRKGG
ncbi:MAG: hypothetical protein B7733_21160 [Myxococcales bacterium FL481]|nr:MAG: hypothetical protein B7733_21160 [Myxococcales bacterium FL481]